MDLAGQLLRPASCLLLVSALGGCGPGVTLTLRDGSMWSGRPIANDDTSVEIQTRDGRYVFCKRDVADADHAGNGAIYAGLLVTAAGAAITYEGETAPNPEGGRGNLFYAEAGLAILAAGVATGSVGLAQFLESKSATGLPVSGDKPPKPCREPVRYVGK